jgi:hypothetical protein
MPSVFQKKRNKCVTFAIKLRQIHFEIIASMKYSKVIFFLLLFPILTAASLHKFYVSTTKIEYVKEKKAIQIITKIFIDDVEDALQVRYNEDISLATEKETATDIAYLKQYVLQKFQLQVNGKPVTLQYIGREYETDIVKVYLEVTGITQLKTLEIDNQVLFDLFEEQQNIIHLKTSEKRRSIVLDKDNPKGVLNFD